MTSLVGQIIDQYQVLDVIGSGGMATVYKAYDPRFDRIVALKTLPSQFATQPAYLERFRREAQVIANLENQHILPVYGFGQDQAITYLVMRYVRGGTLADILKASGGQLPYGDVARIINQVASALTYAHGRGIVHRDIKPSNILLDDLGDCYLMDFGVAKILEGAADLTATGGVIGTPTYMAPEQGEGKAIDGRADIYSLGVMLYEMVTGRTPFERETPYATIVAHIEEPLPPPSTLNPDIPDRIEQIIITALDKNPDNRYQHADDLSTAFHHATQGGAIEDGTLLVLSADLAQQRPSDEVTQIERHRVRPHMSRGRWRVLPVVGAMSLMVLIGLFLFVIRPRGTGDTDRPSANPSLSIDATTTLEAEALEIAAQITQTQVALASTLTHESLLTRTARPPTTTPTPSITPTPFQEGAVLLQEDFEDGFFNRARYGVEAWNIISDETGNRVLQGTTGSNVGFGDISWTNYRLSFRVQIIMRTTSTDDFADFGALIRVNADSPICGSYYARLGTDLSLLVTTNTSSLCPYQQIFDEASMASFEWHDVQIEALDRIVILRIDGSDVLSYHNQAVWSGWAALNVQDGAVVNFDDVEIQELVSD